jgi:hypothetical protein
VLLSLFVLPGKPVSTHPTCSLFELELKSST